MMMVYGVGPWNRSSSRREAEEAFDENETLIKILGTAGAHGGDDDAVVPASGRDDIRI